jgi:CRISPR/Cas system-associated exonuclease Cas4 (RecB family)
MISNNQIKPTLNINNNCKDMDLLNTSSCLNNELNTFYKYNISQIGKTLTDEELKIISKKNIDSNKNIYITGRYDIFDSTNNYLYEIKTSISSSEYTEAWLIQVSFYAIMIEVLFNIKIKKVIIVNILQGYFYEWDLKDDFPKMESIIDTISNKYNWHEVEKNAFLRGIQKLRLKKNDL